MWQLVYTAPESLLPEGAEVIPFPTPSAAPGTVLGAAEAQPARKPDSAFPPRRPVSMTIVIGETASLLEEDDEL